MKSQFIKDLSSTFNLQRHLGARYLLMYAQGRFKDIDFRPVAKGENPWFAHKQYTDKDKFGSRLVAAFDLARTFDEQIPEDMQTITGLDGLQDNPQIHIPRMHDENQSIAMQRRAQIKLVVDNS